MVDHGWFSPASSTTKTGRHDIDEILLKVAQTKLNQAINHTLNKIYILLYGNIKVYCINTPVSCMYQYDLIICHDPVIFIFLNKHKRSKLHCL